MMFYYMIEQWCCAEPEYLMGRLNWETRCLFVESIRKQQKPGFWRQ